MRAARLVNIGDYVTVVDIGVTLLKVAFASAEFFIGNTQPGSRNIYLFGSYRLVA